MENKKTLEYLKAASIIAFVFAGLYFFYSGELILATVAIGTGLFYQNLQKLKEEEIRNKKIIILAVSIFTIIASPISSIIIMLVLDNISDGVTIKENAPPKKIKIIDPTIQKLDILLKLGSIMVLISGIIFSTTTWDTVPNILKLLFCIALGIGFLGLSKFSEEKIKIKTTTNIYYILGLVFLVLGYYSIGYLEIISSYFSLYGEGSNLYLATFYLVIIIALYFLYDRFKSEIYLNGIYISGFLSLVAFLEHFQVPKDYYLLIASTLLLVYNTIKNNKSMKILSVLIVFINLITIHTDNAVLLSLYLIISMLNILIIQNSSDRNIKSIAPIILNLIPVIMISRLNLENNFDEILKTICIVIPYIILVVTRYIDKSIEFKNTYIYTANIVLFFSFVNTLTLEKTTILIVAILIMLTNVIYYLIDKKEKVELNIQPIKLALLLFALLNIIEFISLIGLQVIAIIFIVIYKYINNEELRKMYYLIGVITIIFSIFINQEGYQLLITTLITYLYYASSLKKYKSSMLILFLSVVYITLEIIFISYNYIGYLLSIIIFSLFAFIKKGDEKKIANISILLPFYNLVHNLDIDYEIQSIITITYYLFLVYLINKIFIIKHDMKNKFLTIGSILVTFPYLFTESYLVGIYIGVVALLFIIYSLTNETYKSLFYYGVILTVLNIIIQLKFLWTIIPFWAYLLFGGLSIIAIGTKKLLNETEKK